MCWSDHRPDSLWCLALCFCLAFTVSSGGVSWHFHLLGKLPQSTRAFLSLYFVQLILILLSLQLYHTYCSTRRLTLCSQTNFKSAMAFFFKKCKNRHGLTRVWYEMLHQQPLLDSQIISLYPSICYTEAVSNLQDYGK